MATVQSVGIAGWWPTPAVISITSVGTAGWFPLLAPTTTTTAAAMTTTLAPTTTTTVCPVDCFLIRARQALIAALMADVCVASLVKRWFTFAEGLLERVDLRPADCPQIQVYPDTGTVEVPTNVYDQFTYDINIGMATDWQDVSPCFRILCAVLRVVRTAGRSRLGLTGDCLLSVVPIRFQFQAHQNKRDSRVRWRCVLAVRLTWNRRLP